MDSISSNKENGSFELLVGEAGKQVSAPMKGNSSSTIPLIE